MTKMLFNKPLLIAEGKLDEILLFIDRYNAGVSIPFEPEPRPEPIIEDGRAIIPIHGIISQRMNMIQKASGGVSTEILSDWINDAISNLSVKEIILDIDSPGGSVDGVATLAEIINQARSIKKITAYINSSGLSAAYWLASAANEVILASPTARVGSIGVVAVHKDISKAEEKAGVKTTEVTAGKYKRIYSQYKELSEEGLSALQEEVNYIYQVFVDAVSKYRGISKDAVINTEARIYTGQQAIDIGLADGISNLIKTKGGVYMAQETIDLEALQKEAYERGLKEGNANALAEIEKIKADVVASERARISEIISLAGDYPDILMKAISEGFSAEATGLLLFKTIKERGISMNDVKDGAVMADVVKTGNNDNQEDSLIADMKRRYS